MKWYDLKGYEGFYKITKCGKIKSVARVIVRSNGKPHTVCEKILTHQ